MTSGPTWKVSPGRISRGSADLLPFHPGAVLGAQVFEDKRPIRRGPREAGVLVADAAIGEREGAVGSPADRELSAPDRHDAAGLDALHDDEYRALGRRSASGNEDRLRVARRRSLALRFPAEARQPGFPDADGRDGPFGVLSVSRTALAVRWGKGQGKPGRVPRRVYG